MSSTYQPVITMAELPMEAFEQGSGYASRDADIAGPLALASLGAVLTEVPPGKSACPFHVHHAEDELFVILEGEGEYRFGEHRYSVSAGDALGAPVGGEEYAHKLTNTGTAPLRYLSISSKAAIDVCEYPDSGKYLVRSGQGGAGQSPFVRIGRAESSLDYWDGEESA